MRCRRAVSVFIGAWLAMNVPHQTESEIALISDAGIPDFVRHLKTALTHHWYAVTLPSPDANGQHIDLMKSKDALLAHILPDSELRGIDWNRMNTFRFRMDAATVA